MSNAVGKTISKHLVGIAIVFISLNLTKSETTSNTAVEAEDQDEEQDGELVSKVVEDNAVKDKTVEGVVKQSVVELVVDEGFLGDFVLGSATVANDPSTWRQAASLKDIVRFGSDVVEIVVKDLEHLLETKLLLEADVVELLVALAVGIVGVMETSEPQGGHKRRPLALYIA